MATTPGLILSRGEKLVPLKQVPKLDTPLASRAYQTLIRYAVNGTGDGTRLECVRIGRGLYTSVEAVARFVLAQNRGDGCETAPTAANPTDSAARAALDASQQLAAAGI